MIKFLMASAAAKSAASLILRASSSSSGCRKISAARSGLNTRAVLYINGSSSVPGQLSLPQSSLEKRGQVTTGGQVGTYIMAVDGRPPQRPRPVLSGGLTYLAATQSLEGDADAILFN